ncbi:MAG TPA: hypothetical protein VIN04_00730 [Myxococcota bacterium]
MTSPSLPPASPGAGPQRAAGASAQPRATVALVIRACAAFDLVLTGALAAPPLARALFAALAPAMPDPGAFAWLFVHVTGALGVLWALVRLVRPAPWLGWADAAGRAWVGALLLHAVVTAGVPRVLLLFVVTEWGGSLAQGAVLRAARRARRSAPPSDAGAPPPSTVTPP